MILPLLIIMGSLVIFLSILTIVFFIKQLSYKNTYQSDYKILEAKFLDEKQKNFDVIKRLEDFRQENKDLEDENKELAIEYTKLRERTNALLEEQGKLGQMHTRFKEEFENISRKILEENTEKLTLKSEKSLSNILTPFKENIVNLHNRVNEVYHLENTERHTLKSEIKNIVEANHRLNLQAENLTKALKGDNKVQGNWGEFQLLKILEMIGLKEHQDYTVQAKGLGLKNEEGRTLQPDVMINLTDDKHIVIDAKVSLVAYERYSQEENIDEKQKYLKQFLDSIKEQVKNLSSKGYQNHEKLSSLDFVIMFIPIESAYILSIEKDQNLHTFAWENKVILVSASALYAILSTVANMRRLEKYSKNIDLIAKESGKMYDQFINFIEDLQSVNKSLNNSQNNLDNALKKLSTGNGNLLRRAQKIKDLGATTTKKMPLLLNESDLLTISTNEIDDGLANN
ncbi:DNA recombination protein RmuC [Candidatus Hepatincolaceae symbiont of Richtersius coronifer]